jgi:hypothetical protein
VKRLKDAVTQQFSTKKTSAFIKNETFPSIFDLIEKSQPYFPEDNTEPDTSEKERLKTVKDVWDIEPAFENEEELKNYLELILSAVPRHLLLSLLPKWRKALDCNITSRLPPRLVGYSVWDLKKEGKSTALSKQY